jgi:hypothetical protein
MSKIISVASQYTLYEVEDNIFELLSGGDLVQPAAVVLDVMTMNGQAKRIGVISTGPLVGDENPFSTEDSEDDEEPAEGEGPWLEE